MGTWAPGPGATGGDDVFTGDASNETANGLSGNDTLNGNGGDDTLSGGDGNDRIDGGTGADILIGGPGNDTYFIENAGDVVLEDAVGGTDLVRATVSYVLPANVENLELDGVASLNGTGNSLNNVIGGTNAPNTLIGLAGDDLLAGFGGDDLLIGGAGGDNLDGGSGFDTVSYGDAPVAITLSPNSSSGSFFASGEGFDILSGIERVLGSAFNDTLVGGVGADTLSGGNGDDVLSGGGGDDVLLGDAGADALDGGSGNDSASYAAAPSGVQVFLDNAGSNTGQAAGDTFVSIESITGSAFDDVLQGLAAGGSSLDGGGGNDLFVSQRGGNRFNGGAGVDSVSYVLASAGIGASLATGFGTSGAAGGDVFLSIENLIGSSFNDTLIGDSFANSLTGGAGDDTLIGGGGNDTLNDMSGLNSYDGGLGIDFASVSLATRVGILTYAVGDVSIQENGISLVTFSGIERVSITGGSGNDIFVGGSFDDTLIGGAGADMLTGGPGNDTYGVDSLSDSVVELPGEGLDTVQTTFTNVSVASFANVENLTYIGAAVFIGQGDAGVNVIEGGSGNDYFYAYAGDDTARGNAGVDVFIMAEGNDTVFGGDATDYMYGGDGNDTLNGEGGVDVFLGGEDADTMFGGDEGDFFYGENGDDIAFGEAGNDIFVMTAGNDTASGGDGQDYFYMGDGNDTLNGGDGVDVMLGEAGDDVFNPGLGVDYVFMGTGSDTLNVDKVLSGVTVLNDFTPGAASSDLINLTGTGWTSFAQVQANLFDYTASGGFCVLALDGDTSIWFIGIQPSQLTAGDFVFGP